MAEGDSIPPIEIPVELKLGEAEAALRKLGETFKTQLSAAVAEALEKLKDVKVEIKAEAKREEPAFSDTREHKREDDRPRVVTERVGEEERRFSVMPKETAERDLDKMELRNMLQQIRDSVEQLVALQQGQG